MNIYEAIKSGVAYKRPNHKYWITNGIQKQSDLEYNSISIEDASFNDWEVLEIVPKTFSYECNLRELYPRDQDGSILPEFITMRAAFGSTAKVKVTIEVLE